uniref:Uncharacterized protein n=1 Tax=Clytia hemisphaerica TaxID=252671 RepID=A0A7M5V3H0_9CNID
GELFKCMKKKITIKLPIHNFWQSTIFENMLMLSYLYILWCANLVLSCEDYTPYILKSFGNSNLIDSEEIKGPRSITECVLRCQRKTKEAFYTNDNKCFCHNGVVETQGDASGISTGRIPLNEHKEATIQYSRFKLSFKLEFWAEDNNQNYEAYGHIHVKVGEEDTNNKITLWKVNKKEYLSIQDETTYIVDGFVEFSELQDFDQVGHITVNGRVMETDGNTVDDTIGSPTNDLFQAKDILGKDIMTVYDGEDGAYLKITLKLTKL